ncbi:hypothetical protein [Archangium lipolyticum]|uniref:hypothetical protein n=1 Tax=Archangium lipolyticum TaxID=2970465 RepID=UPI0021499B15|nr:hypothetical protein [Archangium lipolyticum]
MGASITVDDSHWPLLISRFHGVPTDADHTEYLARGEAYLLRGERYVSIVDMGELALLTAAQRQQQAEWLKAHQELIRERLIGCALIVTSPFIRLVQSAIFHVIPMPTSYIVIRDMAEGVKWTTARLAEAGFEEAAERIRRDFSAQPMRRPR